ncbi:hypothetical protein QP162_09085 [Sphingomonas aurantiaca]
MEAQKGDNGLVQQIGADQRVVEIDTERQSRVFGGARRGDEAGHAVRPAATSRTPDTTSNDPTICGRFGTSPSQSHDSSRTSTKPSATKG